MANNFEDAIEEIFGGSSSITEKITKKEKKTDKTKEASASELTNKAKDLYKKALAAQKEGNWAAYGDYIKELGTILDKLK